MNWYVWLVMNSLLAPLAIGGCSAPAGPEFLAIRSEQYDAAFDAAARVAREHGLTPGMRDRRHGIIATEPAKAGSMLEPWDPLNVTFSRTVESTVSHERRVARFEFLPVAFDPRRADSVDETLAGPDILATQREPLDLLEYDGELELRVWVYIERLHQPGFRRSTWTRRKTTRAHVIDPDTGRSIPGSWTPITRDPAVERLLLARVRRSLESRAK